MTTTQYIIKPLAYHPTITNFELLESSNKGLFPSVLLSEIQDDILDKEGPITFMIKTTNGIIPVYVVAHEFSSTDNIIYLPQTIMHNAFINENENATIEMVDLPKITKLTLRPIGRLFAREIQDPKGELEKIIVDQYQILHNGDSIYLNNYELIITNIEPSDVVSTFNTDPVVDFLPCREDEQIENEKKRLLEEKKKEEMEKEKLLQIEKEKEKSEKIKYETYKRTGYKYVPFGGTGNTLNNSIFTTPPNVNSNVNSNIKERKSKSITRVNVYKAFSGEGNKLGN